MKRKIYTRLLLIGVLSIIFTNLCTMLVYYGMFKKQMKEDVRTTAVLLSSLYNQTEDVKSNVDLLDIDGRVTLISEDGTVLYDNQADEKVMENHINRPEVKMALEKGIGQSVHTSRTMGTNAYYCAVKLDDGNVIRYSVNARSAVAVFVGSLPVLLLISIVIFFICLSYAKVMTRQVIKPINDISSRLAEDDVEHIDSPYEELLPFVKAIKERNERIANEIAKLQFEKNKIEAVMENMSEGMILLDEKMRVVTVNDSAVKMLDGNMNCVGRNILFFSRNETLSSIAKDAISGHKVSKDIYSKGKWFQVIGSPVDNEGVRIGAILLILDITEKKETETIRREFTANVSHELKTPLTSITGYSELIESGMAAGEDARRFASKINQEALRLLTLIGDILKISELEELKEEKQFDKVDLEDVIRECVDNLKLQAESKNVTIETIIPKPALIQGKRDLAEVIVYNLCDNAIRYNVENGMVIITFKDNVLSVKDTGIGIPKEYHSRIFERFFRVDKSRSKETGGTGLGLAIVKHAAKRLDATIEFESEPRKGTEIKIYFKGWENDNKHSSGRQN